MDGIVHSIDRNLSLKPISQFGETFFKSDSRLVPESFLCMRNICETIADIANAAFSYDFGFDILLSKNPRHLLCDVEDRVMSTAAYVEHFAGGFRSLQGKTARTRDVAHVNEIAPLFAVLINKRPIVIQEARSKNGENAGIRIRKGLASAEDVKETQRYSVDAVGAADRHAEALLMKFANSINRRQRRAF